jgi:hypothetical protein
LGFSEDKRKQKGQSQRSRMARLRKWPTAVSSLWQRQRYDTVAGHNRDVLLPVDLIGKWAGPDGSIMSIQKQLVTNPGIERVELTRIGAL